MMHQFYIFLFFNRSQSQKKHNLDFLCVSAIKVIAQRHDVMAFMIAKSYCCKIPVFVVCPGIVFAVLASDNRCDFGVWCHLTIFIPTCDISPTMWTTHYCFGINPCPLTAITAKDKTHSAHSLASQHIYDSFYVSHYVFLVLPNRHKS